MLIIGIAGGLCSGKRTLANLLQATGNFELFQSTSPDETLSFDTTDALPHQQLTEKLKNMTQNLVICPVNNFSDLHILQKDTRFVLISLDSPVRLRYQRYVKTYGKKGDSLRNFLEKDDFLLYSAGLSQLIQSADRIFQNSGTIEDLASQLTSLEILKMVHQRPAFDLYFIRIAELVSTRSACLIHRGGCVVTNSNKIISTGYSGIPKAAIQCIEGGCELCMNHENTNCLCSHAEINAIIEAKQKKLQNCSVYTKIFPCLNCAQAIIQVKAKRVFFSHCESLVESIENYLKNAGVEVSFISVVG